MIRKILNYFLNKRPLEVKIKPLSENAVIPKYAKPGDAGMDLTATSLKFDHCTDNWIYGTSLAFEIPAGYVGLIFPRSSNRNTGAYMANSVSVIDSGYRGEVFCTFKNRDYDNRAKPYEIGDRVGQMIIVPFPFVKFVITDKLSETERGTGGHGSTGK